MAAGKLGLWEHHQVGPLHGLVTSSSVLNLWLVIIRNVVLKQCALSDKKNDNSFVSPLAVSTSCRSEGGLPAVLLEKRLGCPCV